MRTGQRKPMELFPLIVLFFIVAILRTVVRSARRAGRGSWGATVVPIVFVVAFALPLVAGASGRSTVFRALLFVAFFSTIVGVLIALIRRAQPRPGDVPTLRSPPGASGRNRPRPSPPTVLTPPTKATAPAREAAPRAVVLGRADSAPESRSLDRPVSKTPAPMVRPAGGSPAAPSRKRPPSTPRPEAQSRPTMDGGSPGRRGKPVSEQLVEEARKKYYRSR
jgi:hypothetical protein